MTDVNNKIIPISSLTYSMLQLLFMCLVGVGQMPNKKLV